MKNKPTLVFQDQTRHRLADWLKLRFEMYHLDLLHYTVTTTKWKKKTRVMLFFHVAAWQISSTSQNRSPLIAINLLVKLLWIKCGDPISDCLSSACFLSPEMCGQRTGDLNLSSGEKQPSQEMRGASKWERRTDSLHPMGETFLWMSCRNRHPITAR